NSDVSGIRSLRQEPVRSYAVRADVEGEYGAFRFPVQLYLTTDESSAYQPRNRMSIGVERGALDETTVSVLVDDYDLTSESKISTTSVRLLHSERLGAGRHEIRVSGRLLSGERLPDLEWHVIVEGDGAVASSGTGARQPRFSGKTLIDTRNSDVSGIRSLRQEPVRSYAVRADVEGEYGAFRFPVQLYLTTDESSAYQPRNRMSIGVEGPMFALYAGDRNPRISPLLMNGARTRGFHGEFHGPGVHVQATLGRLRRGLEAREVDTPPGEVFRPVPGTFQRNITAVKLGFGDPGSVLFELSGLKARDDTTSIAFGQNPLENVVLGSDLTTRFLRGKLRFQTGAAISLTTNDISRGVSTKAEIDSLFDTDLPVDPSDFDWLIVLNPSTVPLRIDKLTSTAWYANARVSVPGHSISAEIRTVGSAYFSAANPFLQADRRTITISDRFRLDQGRIGGLVRYQNYQSLPDGGEVLELRSHLAETRLNLALKPGLPRVTGGLRMQWRRRGDGVTGTLASDLRVSTIMLGGVQSFRTGAVRHAARVQYTRTARRDDVNSLFDNTTHAFTIGSAETYPGSFRSDVQLTHLVVNYAGQLGRQRWTTGAATVAYRFYRNDAEAALTVRSTRSGATSLTPASERYGIMLTTSLNLQQNMRIEVQGGYNDYSEDRSATNKYTERFIRLRHTYTF
ncbi:MAG: hypothetical protein R3178_04425, partial [Rhodothermales bacterium]|nr:hypothetical protein [Rhodothermales bacterium]